MQTEMSYRYYLFGQFAKKNFKILIPSQYQLDNDDSDDINGVYAMWFCYYVSPVGKLRLCAVGKWGRDHWPRGGEGEEILLWQ